MLTNLDPSSELFLADLNRIQRRMATANRQVSSGKRITVASDAPDEIGSLLQLRADQERNAQIQYNLGPGQDRGRRRGGGITGRHEAHGSGSGAGQPRSQLYTGRRRQAEYRR